MTKLHLTPSDPRDQYCNWETDCTMQHEVLEMLEYEVMKIITVDGDNVQYEIMKLNNKGKLLAGNPMCD